MERKGAQYHLSAHILATCSIREATLCRWHIVWTFKPDTMVSGKNRRDVSHFTLHTPLYVWIQTRGAIHRNCLWSISLGFAFSLWFEADVVSTDLPDSGSSWLCVDGAGLHTCTCRGWTWEGREVPHDWWQCAGRVPRAGEVTSCLSSAFEIYQYPTLKKKMKNLSWFPYTDKCRNKLQHVFCLAGSSAKDYNEMEVQLLAQW